MRFLRRRNGWVVAGLLSVAAGAGRAEEWADEPAPALTPPAPAAAADPSRATFTAGVHGGHANEATGAEWLVGLRAGVRLWLSTRLLGTLAFEYDFLTSVEAERYDTRSGWTTGTAQHHRLAITVRLEVSHRRAEATPSALHRLPRVSVGVLLSPTLTFYGAPAGSVRVPPPPTPGARLGLGLYLTRPEPSGAWVPVFVELAGTAILLDGKGYPGLRVVGGVGL